MMDSATAVSALEAAKRSFKHGRGEWATAHVILYSLAFLIPPSSSRPSSESSAQNPHRGSRKVSEGVERQT